MKKSLLIGLLGLAASVATTLGQGTIFLDNYFTGGPNITYGANVPVNGVSGANGTVGNGVVAGWTMGLYYAVGNVTGSIASDPTGIADPGTLGGGLALGAGAGSTAALYTSSFNTPGQGFSGSFFAVPGTALAGGDTITLMTIAYSGPNYANAGFRGHSAPFTMTTSSSSSPSPNAVGTTMPGFSVLPVPEPSIFALSGLGAAALMLIRRKK
jgi:hypothetical protein